jgi:replicative DNA helicase
LPKYLRDEPIGLTIGENVAKGGRSVLFVSLEMRAVELARRIAARASGVSGVSMRRGVEASDLQAIDDAARGFNETPLRIWDPPSATLADIRRRVRAERRRGADAVIIDYLQLIRPADSRKSRYEQVGEMSAGLKALAKECDVPIVCLAQLGRDAETDIPRLHHLRESGSIEQDADMVFLLDRPELRVPKDLALAGQASLFLAKNRHGPTGEYALTFDGPTMTFSEPDADDWGTGQEFEANDFNFPTSDDWGGTNSMEATSFD